MPIITFIEQDCGAITVYWSNDSNAASIELDRGATSRSFSLIPRDFKKPFPWWFYDNNNGVGLNPNATYSYTVTNWNSAGRSGYSSANGSPISCQMPWSGSLIRSTFDTFESKADSYELLFSQGTFIDHYSHRPGTLQEKQWQHVNRLNVPEGGTIPDNAVSLIQSGSRNFIAVALVTPREISDKNYLISYVFDSSSGWEEPTNLSTENGPIRGTTGAPAIIQSEEGTFILLVPRGSFIDHYIHDAGSIKEGVWKFVTALTSPQGEDEMQSAVAFTQIASGGFEVIAHVVPQTSPQQQKDTSPADDHKDYLISYTYKSSDPLSSSPKAVPLTVSGKTISGITGSPSLIQNAKNGFELLVPRGPFIDHYTHPKGSIEDGLWSYSATLRPPKNEVEPVVTAVSVVESPIHSLEVVARITPKEGDGKDELISYELPRWQGPFGIHVDDDPTIVDTNEVKQSK